MIKSKEELIEVYHDTINTISVCGYNNSKQEWVNINPVKNSYFHESLKTIKDPKKFNKTIIEVKNMDTLVAAKLLGPECAVLNMASWRRPGGGVSTGSKAQEEELCRRTNLLSSLYYFYDIPANPLYSSPFDRSKFKYPIPYYGSIYSPEVTVFKSESYNNLESPFKCSVISVSAISHPKLIKGEFSEEDSISMKGKIRAILRTAMIHGHSKIVLGAFGCGAYKCPPDQVAELFKSVLEEKEFLESFEHILFAVLSTGNNNNYKIFKETLCTK